MLAESVMDLKGFDFSHEPQCEITYLLTCAEQRLKSACTSDSDQILHCPHEETLYSWPSKMHSEDCDQIAKMHRLI